MDISFEVFLISIGSIGFTGYVIGFHVSSVIHRKVLRKYFKGIK